ncbi:hypothetical protein VTN00DRAFT_75 [Thermoascus crustaceus]|uniref:uncharacterized protein n=1 Tax=Thermoascus crustaceus TaxID=5088 RepID=UPI003741FE27
MKSTILAVAASLAGTSLAGPINLNRVPTPAGLYGVPSLSGVPTPTVSGIPSVPTPAMTLGSDIPSPPKVARPDLPIVQGLNLANLPAGLPLGALHRRQLSGISTSLPLPVDQGSVNHVVDASGLAPFTDVDQTVKKVENEPKDFVNKVTKIVGDEPLVRRELPLDAKLPQGVDADINANGVPQALNGLPIKTGNVPDKVDNAKNSVPLDMNPVNRLPVTARDVHVNTAGTPVKTNVNAQGLPVDAHIDARNIPVEASTHGIDIDTSKTPLQGTADAHVHMGARNLPVTADTHGVEVNTDKTPLKDTPVKADVRLGARNVDVNTNDLPIGTKIANVNAANIPAHAEADVTTRGLPLTADNQGIKVDTDKVLPGAPAQAHVAVGGN